MTTIQRRFPVLLVAALWACGETQDATRVIVDYPAASRVPGATVLPGSDRRDTLTVAIAGRSVPLAFEWNVARDPSGCLHPARVRVERTGGDPRLVLDTVVVHDVPCGEIMDSIPESTAMLTVDAHTRNGLTMERGDMLLAQLFGSGRFSGRLAKRPQPPAR